MAGLLFTTSGDRFTATHAKKGAKHYRYYGTTTDQPTRLPAREVEQVVILGVMAFLRDEEKILSLVQDRKAARVVEVLALAKAAAGRIEQANASVREAVQDVRIGDVGLTIKLRKELLELEEDISFSIPAQLKRCGMAMRLVVKPQGRAEQLADQKLVALVAKGQDWFKRLASGRASSPKEIAAQESCSPAYATRLIWLAFLAPDIVEKIGGGGGSSRRS